MSGECDGWSDWDTFKKAGVVDEHIDFNDNKVVVDNVLGRTGDKIGKCFAIDAAVAYTLSKAGPDANLTVQDMVNEYTRTATVIMQKTVGWGKPFLTGTVDGVEYGSCGHDEVEADIINLTAPVYDAEAGFIKLDRTGWRSVMMKDFLETNRAPEHIQALASFRMQRDEYYGLRVVDVMLSERMKPLKDWIENHFDCTTWRFCSATLDYEGRASVNWTELRYSCRIERTRGTCGYSLDGSHRYCTYHDADERAERDWWMVADSKGRFSLIWDGSRTHRDSNDNMFTQSGIGYHGMRLVRFSDVRRKMANSIDEAEVKRQIKKALIRMTKRRKNIVSLTNGAMGDGAPEDRTYRWKDWSWLAVIQQAVAQTSKKMRKEGDVVNGWKYTKTSSKRSYGHEIAEFEWRADGEVATYSVTLAPSGGYSYYTSTNSLPFRFKTAEEAVKFNKMMAMIAVKAGATAFNREWDKAAGEDAPINCDRLGVETHNHAEKMKMVMEKDPEDLPSPTEIVQKVFFGLPNEYGPATEHLIGSPFDEFKVKVIETEVTA